MPYLTKQDILEAQDIERAEVDVEEWGGTVLVRGLTAQQYIGMGFDLRGEGDEIDPEKAKEMMPLIVAMGVIDEDGETLFSQKEAGKLAKKSFGPVNRISTKILELSGLGGEAPKN